MRGIGKLQIRAWNRACILTEILHQGPIPRATIANSIGLTRSATTILCDELLKENLIAETSTVSTGKQGRKQVPLRLTTDLWGFGVLLSAEGVSLGLSTLTFQMHDVATARWRQFHGEPYTLVEWITEHVQVALQNHEIRAENVLGLGIAVDPSLFRALDVEEDESGDLHIRWLQSGLKNTLPFSTAVYDAVHAFVRLGLSDKGKNVLNRDILMLYRDNGGNLRLYGKFVDTDVGAFRAGDKTLAAILKTYETATLIQPFFQTEIPKQDDATRCVDIEALALCLENIALVTKPDEICLYHVGLDERMLRTLRRTIAVTDPQLAKSLTLTPAETTQLCVAGTVILLDTFFDKGGIPPTQKQETSPNTTA